MMEDEAEFAHFLDGVPLGNQFADIGSNGSCFSQVYGKILAAQKEQPLAIQIGNSNYQNKENWIAPLSIPKYNPTYEMVNSQMGGASKGKIEVESNQQAIKIPTTTEFPNIITSAPLVDFYEKVASSNFTTTISFDHCASLSINVGAWFFAGAFLYAYQTPDNWNSEIISWNDVFDPTSGILKYINSSVAVVSNMKIELSISGEFDAPTVEMLKGILKPIIFPFYEPIDNATLDVVLEEDKSICIVQTLPEDANYIFGIAYQDVKQLLS